MNYQVFTRFYQVFTRFITRFLPGFYQVSQVYSAQKSQVYLVFLGIQVHPAQKSKVFRDPQTWDFHILGWGNTSFTMVFTRFYQILSQVQMTGPWVGGRRSITVRNVMKHKNPEKSPQSPSAYFLCTFLPDSSEALFPRIFFYVRPLHCIFRSLATI